MSRRGNCYDNAHSESFWSRFKAELLDGGSFPSLAEAKLEIIYHVATTKPNVATKLPIAQPLRNPLPSCVQLS
jgi:transposase InsO family protein